MLIQLVIVAVSEHYCYSSTTSLTFSSQFSNLLLTLTSKKKRGLLFIVVMREESVSFLY